jgi:hypothetical protein
VLGGRPLTLVTGACAAIPVIVSTVHAIQYRWEPTDDKAIIATRSWDVLTNHTPLLGQYSTVSEVIRHSVYTVGPLQYWLTALPTRFGSSVSIAVTMGVVNTLAVVGSVALARRRGGLTLMLLAAVAIALMWMSLPSESLHDTWNSAVPLCPFLLLLFLCWSLACGEYRLLPITVLVASLVVQTHLSYLAPVAGLMAIGLGGLAAVVIVRVLSARRRARARGLDGAPVQAVRGGSLLRWSLAALLVGGVCWTPTIIDQATSRPGNLTRAVQVATAPQATLGARVGWHAVVRAIGYHPWWLYTPATRWDRYHDVLAKPDLISQAVAIALLAALALVASVAAWRRRYDVVVAALIGLVLCGALGSVAAQTWTIPNLASTTGYTLWWGTHVGMWVYVVLAWSIWLGLRAIAAPRLRAPLQDLRRRAGAVRWRRASMAAAVLASLLGTAAVSVAGGAVSAGAKTDQHLALYAPIAKLDAALQRAIPSNQTVRLEGGLDGATLPLKAAIRFVLVRRDIRVLATGSLARNGDWYELHDRPYNMTLYVSDHTRPPGKHVSLVARVSFREAGIAHTLTVWLSRVPGHGRRSAVR